MGQCEGPRAGDHGAEDRIGIRADGEVIRGHHCLDAGDANDTGARLQRQVIVPCRGAYRHRARAVGTAESEVRPAIGDAAHFGRGQVDGARPAREADGRAHTHRRQGEVAGAGQRNAAEDGNVPVRVDGQVVGAHPDGAIHVDGAGARLQGQVIAPGRQADVHCGGRGGAAEDDVVPAIRNISKFRRIHIIRTHGRIADAEGGRIRVGAEGEGAGAGKGRVHLHVRRFEYQTARTGIDGRGDGDEVVRAEGEGAARGPVEDRVHENVAERRAGRARLHDHIARGEGSEQGRGVQHRGRVVRIRGEGRTAGHVAIRTRRDGDVGGVEQQGAVRRVHAAQVHRAVEVQPVLAGDLDEAATAALRATGGFRTAIEARRFIRPDDDAAAIAALFAVGAQQGVRGEVGIFRRRQAGAALIITTDADVAAIAGTRRVDDRSAVELDAVGEDLHRAAIFACRIAARVDAAAHLHRACGAWCVRGEAFGRKHYLAGARADAVGLNVTRIEDQRIDRATRLRCGHQHRATIGHQRAFVGHGLLGDGVTRFEGDQPVARHVNRVDVARGEHHLAEFRCDEAMVLDMRRDQPCKAGLAHRDLPAVDDRRIRIACFRKTQRAAGHEGRVVADIGGGGDQPADIDPRMCAEHHAVRVQEHDLPVGVDDAVDVRGLAVADAIDGDGAGARLAEIDALAHVHIELVPADNGAIACLLDGRGAAGLLDGGVTGDRGAALRCGPCGRCNEECSDERSMADNPSWMCFRALFHLWIIAWNAASS